MRRARHAGDAARRDRTGDPARCRPASRRPGRNRAASRSLQEMQEVRARVAARRRRAAGRSADRRRAPPAPPPASARRRARNIADIADRPGPPAARPAPSRRATRPSACADRCSSRRARRWLRVRTPAALCALKRLVGAIQQAASNPGVFAGFAASTALALAFSSACRWRCLRRAICPGSCRPWRRVRFVGALALGHWFRLSSRSDPWLTSAGGVVLARVRAWIKPGRRSMPARRGERTMSGGLEGVVAAETVLSHTDPRARHGLGARRDLPDLVCVVWLRGHGRAAVGGVRRRWPDSRRPDRGVGRRADGGVLWVGAVARCGGAAAVVRGRAARSGDAA